MFASAERILPTLETFLFRYYPLEPRKEVNPMQDENSLNDDDQNREGGLKAWLEDNLRIVLSILVVFAIAGGIYSYSQRSQTPVITEEMGTQDTEVALSNEEEPLKTEESDKEIEEPENNTAPTTETPEKSADPVKESVKKEANPTEPTIEPTKEEPAKEVVEEAKPIKEEVKPVVASGESKETEVSFIESAVAGDSLTTLARKALADSLEKNPDSSLSAEHRVYIEDYLRKNSKHTSQVFVGTSVEFSKSLIQEAIGKSKQLNDQQLTNLKKYADRVSSY